ncbi:MAG TPA: hypothetical protein VJH96_02610 [Patescibacteria group bacterium]|nr:hypothetical protein [Patescibacteria group bacterium]
MDIAAVIVSVNKIAIVAFFITGLFLGYEMYLFLKEEARAKKVQRIPDFTEFAPGIKPKIVTLDKKSGEFPSQKKRSPLVIVVLVSCLVFFGILIVMKLFIAVPGNDIFNSLKTSKIEPTPSFVSSEGIKIYTEKWEELKDEQLHFLKTGDTIFIGIKTIPGIDIEKARIHINVDVWSLKDQTERFNRELNVFYTTHIVASEESRLKIEAQLYSQKDGWLGN